MSCSYFVRSTEMSLESLGQLGRVEVEKQIAPNFKVKLRTLTSREYAVVMKAAGALTQNLEQTNSTLATLGSLTDIQIITLAQATVSFNGQSFPEDKRVEENRKIYESLQHPLLVEAYKAYLQLLDDQNNVLEDLKKNSTALLLEKTI